MEVVALTLTDRRLLAARYTEHANSHTAMRTALVGGAHGETVRLLDALREVERAFDLDLGLVAYLYQHRGEPDRHPIEKVVIDFITDVQPGDGDEVLWVLPDRVRQVRDLMQGGLVGGRD